MLQGEVGGRVPASGVRGGQVEHRGTVDEPCGVTVEVAHRTVPDHERLEDTVAAYRGEVVDVERGQGRVEQFRGGVTGRVDGDDGAGTEG